MAQSDFPVTHIMSRFLRIVLLWTVLAAPLAMSAKSQEITPPAVTQTGIGIELYKQGNNNSAIRTLQEVVARDKADADAWYFLGLALNRSGDVKEAREAFGKVIKLRPGHVDAQLGLGYSLLRLNKLKQAASVVKPIVNKTSAGEAAHYILGTVALQQNSYSKALEEADAALMVKANYPPALLLKSRALFGLYLDGVANPKEKNKKDVNAKDLKPDVRSHAKAAADTLAKYVELQKDDKDIAVWREQLETLRIYAGELPDDHTVLTGKDVSTKARILRKPEPRYTEAARYNAVTGIVTLRAIFGSDGTVRGIRVVRGLSDGLTESAIGAARRIKFLPAIKDGRTVSMYFQLEYYFNLY